MRSATSSDDSTISNRITRLPLEALFDRAERRHNRALQFVRQENDRRGGKSRKSNRLQELIDEIVAKSPRIDCPTLLRLLRDKQGAGVIVDVDEEEIAFTDAGPIENCKDCRAESHHRQKISAKAPSSGRFFASPGMTTAATTLSLVRVENLGAAPTLRS